MIGFTDERHCLFVGWVMGRAVRAGLIVEPVVDDEGNYTDRFVIEMDDYPVTVVVPYPPDDWTLLS